MGENSAIEWTDHTWNPWYGCHKVSAGCQHCYMFREQRRYGRDPNVVQRSKTTFRAPLSWAKKARATGERFRVFPSWSDFFIREADPWRDEAWGIIRDTPELIYLILTKRPELALSRLPADWGDGWDHVWLGVSCEDQPSAVLRIKQFLPVPSKHRLLSLEPLLGWIDLPLCFEPDDDDYDVVNAIQDANDDCEPEQFIEECEEECDWVNYGDDLVVSSQWKEWVEWRRWRAGLEAMIRQIDWIIVGGESGPDARPCNPGWVRSIRDLCEGEIPFFFKQWGEYLPVEPGPDQRTQLDVEYLKVGRKQAGCLLDGREWREFPEF